MVLTLRQRIAAQYSYARPARFAVRFALPAKAGAKRQRRKIVEPLYHVHSSENKSEAHDSMNASLQQSCRIVCVHYTIKPILGEMVFSEQKGLFFCSQQSDLKPITHPLLDGTLCRSLIYFRPSSA